MDKAELEAVANVMRQFEKRCNALSKLVNEKMSNRHARPELEHLYKDLKADLKQAAKYGTLSGRRQPLTRIESAFFDAAVRRAHIALRPATNSNPQKSHWVGALFEAGSEFSYYLYQMDKMLQER